MLKNSLTTMVAIFLTGVVLGSSRNIERKPNRDDDLQIVAARLNISPEIDGRLEELAWREAARTGNFTEIEPRDNVKPEVQTEVLVGYDDEYLYIAFICYESNVNEIRATFTNRDEIVGDDRVSLYIDTFGDLQRAYLFKVNPYGVEDDGIYSSISGSDMNFDAVWESAGKIFDDRWCVEMRIPFKTICFPRKGRQHWRVHFIRVRPRQNVKVYSWVPVSRDNPSFLAQAGHLLINEKIGTSRDIEFLPYVIVAQTGVLTNPGDPASFHNDKGRGNIGLSAKYGISSDLTLDLAFNPDYSQIETDVTQIDVNTTFALFYPEKRPFFFEGKDIFETPIDVIYTRSINDPLFAAKFTGKVGKTSIAYIIARDQHTPWIIPSADYSFPISSDKPSLSNILRVKHDILEGSCVGMLVTDRELSKSFNRVAGFDGNIRFWKNYFSVFQVVRSWTKEPTDTIFVSSSYPTFKKHTLSFDGERFNGIAYSFWLKRETRYWDSSIFYRGFSPEFRADNGFIVRNDFRQCELSTCLKLRWAASHLIEQIAPSFSIATFYNYDGESRERWLGTGIWASLKGQTTLLSIYSSGFECFKGKRFNNLWRFRSNIRNHSSELMSGEISFSFGKSINYRADPPSLGYSQSFDLVTEIKPIKKLRFSVDFSRYWLWDKESGKEIYDVFVLYNKTTYQFSKHLSLRLVTQYYSSTKRFEFYPLLSYELGPFTVFYIGLTSHFKDFDDPYGFRETDRQFFIKVRYLFKTTAEEIIGKVGEIF